MGEGGFCPFNSVTQHKREMKDKSSLSRRAEFYLCIYTYTIMSAQKKKKNPNKDTHSSGVYICIYIYS